jgi:hypothetical protein
MTIILKWIVYDFTRKNVTTKIILYINAEVMSRVFNNLINVSVIDRILVSQN